MLRQSLALPCQHRMRLAYNYPLVLLLGWAVCVALAVAVAIAVAAVVEHRSQGIARARVLDLVAVEAGGLQGTTERLPLALAREPLRKPPRTEQEAPATWLAVAFVVAAAPHPLAAALGALAGAARAWCEVAGFLAACADPGVATGLLPAAAVPSVRLYTG